MNKNLKIILIVAGVVTVAIAAGVLYLIVGPQKHMEDVLPKGALAYVRLEHPAAYWQKGVKSEFFNQLKSIDLEALLAHNKMPPAQIKQIEKFRQEIVAFFQNPLTQKFLEKEISFAMYKKPGTGLKKNTEDDFSLMIVLRLPVSMRVMMANSSLANRLTDQVTLTQELYKGRRLVHVVFKDKKMSFNYTMVGGLLIASTANDPMLYKAIDVIVKDQLPLSTDAHCQFALAHAYSKADSLAFINIEQLPLGKSGLGTYAFSFLPGTVNKYRFSLAMNGDDPKLPLVKLASCQVQDNGSLSFIPSTIVSYQWNTCYDFKDMWEKAIWQMQAVSGQDKQMGRLLKGLEKRLGMSIKSDLLPVLGQEAGGYLTDIDTLGIFPYPRFLAFIKVNDRAKAETVLSKMMEGRLGVIQEEKYNQVGIHYMPLPLGSNMDPGYCFVGDYLLAASSRQLLKKSIDTYKDPETSIKTEKTFNSLQLQDPPQAQSVTFLKVGEFSKRLKDIFHWTDKYLSSQVTAVNTYQMESNQKKAEIFDDINAKEEEMKLAQAKLKELKTKDLSILSPEDQQIETDNMKNIQGQLDHLSADIQNGKQQADDIDKQLGRALVQAQRAQDMMYNAQHVIVPLLNGLESLNALGMRVYVKDKVFETELLVK